MLLEYLSYSLFRLFTNILTAIGFTNDVKPMGMVAAGLQPTNPAPPTTPTITEAAGPNPVESAPTQGEAVLRFGENATIPLSVAPNGEGGD